MADRDDAAAVDLVIHDSALGSSSAVGAKSHDEEDDDDA
jgi:hypothetical protein